MCRRREVLWELQERVPKPWGVEPSARGLLRELRMRSGKHRAESPQGRGVRWTCRRAEILRELREQEPKPRGAEPPAEGAPPGASDVIGEAPSPRLPVCRGAATQVAGGALRESKRVADVPANGDPPGAPGAGAKAARCRAVCRRSSFGRSGCGRGNTVPRRPRVFHTAFAWDPEPGHCGSRDSGPSAGERSSPGSCGSGCRGCEVCVRPQRELLREVWMWSESHRVEAPARSRGAHRVNADARIPRDPSDRAGRCTPTPVLPWGRPTGGELAPVQRASPQHAKAADPTCCGAASPVSLGRRGALPRSSEVRNHRRCGQGVASGDEVPGQSGRRSRACADRCLWASTGTRSAWVRSLMSAFSRVYAPRECGCGSSWLASGIGIGGTAVNPGR